MENSLKFDEFDNNNNMSGEGYEEDDSRMSDEQSISSNEQNGGKRKRRGKQIMMPIARKRRTGPGTFNTLTDSGYDQDMSSDMAVFGNGHNADTAKRNVLDKVEETQVLPFSLGNYVDHSLDPDVDDRPFAPLHRKPNFPESVFAILSNPGLSSIVKWLPHGRSFIVLNRDEFAKGVLPVYFRHSKVSSFNRQLNGYGFNKIKIGPHEKSYYHPFFLRNLPHLVKNIKRCGEKLSSDELSIMDESHMERISAERPLPKKMSPTYANHIQEMNRAAYQGFGLQELIEQSVAPAASAVPAFTVQNERCFHPVPSVIYTPPQCPLPPVIYTPPPEQQQQPQLSPSPGSARGLQIYGNATSPCQQGTVFTQSHLPLTGFIPNPAMQNLLFPLQTQPFLPFQQQQPGSSQASPCSVPMNASVAVGQSNVAQAIPQNPIAQDQAQVTQAQAVAIAYEARRQAQVQLFANALAAATGYQGPANFQHLSLLVASQLAMNPGLNISPTTQSSPSSQSPYGLQQPNVNANTSNPAQSGSNLQHQNDYSSTSGPDHNTFNQQDQTNVQPMSILGASQLVTNPTLNITPTMQSIANSQMNLLQQQRNQSNPNSEMMNDLQQQFRSNLSNYGNNDCSNKTDGQQTREM